MWVKKYVKIRVILFKHWKPLFKIPYQTPFQKFKTYELVGKHLITPISFLSLQFYTIPTKIKFLSNHFLSSISMLPKISPRTPKSNQTDNTWKLINEAINGPGLGPEQDGTQTMWETESKIYLGLQPQFWNWGNSIQPIKPVWLVIISSIIKVMIIDHVERTTSIIHSWLWIRHKKYTGCYPFAM